MSFSKLPIGACGGLIDGCGVAQRILKGLNMNFSES